MARPIKKGLDYFPFDTDFFSDKKIRILKGKYGAEGITIYLYLLTLIYNDEGYYTSYDDDLIYVVADELNMDDDMITQVIKFLCERKLFDLTLSAKEHILTSRGIQSRFQKAKSDIGKKKNILVNKNYWLLDGDEKAEFIVFSEKEVMDNSYSGNNEGFSGNNEGFSPINDTNKIKENKIKENKIKVEVKESKKENSLAAADDCEKSFGNSFIKEYLVKGKMRYSQYTELMQTGCDASLVEYAIKEAIDHDKENYAYIKAIVNNHVKAGRLSGDEAKEHQYIKNGKTADYKDYEVFKSDRYDYEALEKASVEL